MAVADRAGDDALRRCHARRCGCVVFANLDAPEWPARLDEMLSLSLALGSAWEEAERRATTWPTARWCSFGDDDAALAELARALEAAERVGPRNGFVRGLILCSRAEVGLGRGDATGALADARRGDGVAAARRAARAGCPTPTSTG